MTNEQKTAEQFYEKNRLAGETYNITSNDHPNYHEPFYQCIFRLMEKYSDQQNAELRERVKELEAIVGETYEPSKYNDGFLQWVDKYFYVKPRVQWFISMSTGRRSTIQEIERQYERAMLESPLIKSK